MRIIWNRLCSSLVSMHWRMCAINSGGTSPGNSGSACTSAMQAVVDAPDHVHQLGDRGGLAAAMKWALARNISP